MTNVAELKRSIADLQSSADALADLLARVRDEGQVMNEDWRWVDDFMKMIALFQKKLSEGMRTRDPVVIEHAARNFTSIRRYFWDLPPDWSKLYQQLKAQVSETAARGDKVAVAINPFDPDTLAEIRRSL